MTTCKKCGGRRGESCFGPGLIGADTQNDEIHVLFRVTWRDGSSEPCGSAVLRMKHALHMCETRLAGNPLARSVEARRCDSDQLIARMTRVFADDPADKVFAMANDIAGALLIEPRSKEVGAPKGIKGFVSGANYYHRLVGGGPGTITKEEAQRMFDEEKKRQAEATGAEWRECLTNFVSGDPAASEAAQRMFTEINDLRKENNLLRRSLDDVNREYDALIATANRIILRIAHLESLVTPISEADVGKTVGVTGIHDGETTQTLRDGAGSPGEICPLCGGRSCGCPPVCPACRGRHSSHCMKNTMGWPCICGDVDCRKKQGSALEADELRKGRSAANEKESQDKIADTATRQAEVWDANWQRRSCAARTSETPMHWTTEKPTQPGFYWQRYTDEPQRPRLYEIDWVFGGSPKYPSDKLHILWDWRFIESMETSEWCAVTIERPPS